MAPLAGAKAADTPLAARPLIDLKGGSIDELFTTGRPQIEKLLPDYLAEQRWYSGKTQALESVHLRSVVPVADDAGTTGHVATIDVRYAPSKPKPGIATETPAPELYAHTMVAQRIEDIPDGSTLLKPMARVRAAEGEYVLSDGMGNERFTRSMVGLMRRNAVPDGAESLAGHSSAALKDAATGVDQLVLRVPEQHSSNTNVVMANPGSDTGSMLKLVRRLDVDPSDKGALDVAMGAWLTDSTSFRNSPALHGSLDLVAPGEHARTISTLVEQVPNPTDAWSFALEQLGPVIGSAARGQSDEVSRGVHAYAERASRHGQRLGELQVANVSGPKGSEFSAVAPGAGRDAEQAVKLRADIATMMSKVHEGSIELPPGVLAADFERALTRHAETLIARPRVGAPPDLIHPAQRLSPRSDARDRRQHDRSTRRADRRPRRAARPAARRALAAHLGTRGPGAPTQLLRVRRRNDGPRDVNGGSFAGADRAHPDGGDRVGRARQDGVYLGLARSDARQVVRAAQAGHRGGTPR